MHILQPTCNARQLDGSSVRLLRDQVTTYNVDTVYLWVPLDELVDVSVVHPLGNKSKSIFG